MPEPLDFEQIATVVLTMTVKAKLASRVADQLRQVWNARGAADVDAVRGYLNDAITLDMVSVIKALDR
jgi:hypothetical protein